MVVRGCRKNNQSATRSNEPFGLTGVPTKSSAAEASPPSQCADLLFLMDEF